MKTTPSCYKLFLLLLALQLFPDTKVSVVSQEESGFVIRMHSPKSWGCDLIPVVEQARDLLGGNRLGMSVECRIHNSIYVRINPRHLELTA